MRGRLALISCFCLVAGACQMAGPGTAGPAAGGRAAPVVSPGPITRAEEAEADELYRSAETSFESRRFFEVLRTTQDLLDRFPSASVSGAALLLSARAELEVGAADRADAAAQRYLDLLPDGDPRATEAVLIQVDALQGDPASQLDRLLRIGSADPEQLEIAYDRARTAVDSLGFAELDSVVAAAPVGGVVAPVPQAALSVELLDRGEVERAQDLAGTALAAGVPEPERSEAEGVLRGELPANRARVTDFAIGMVLPEGGPPALSEYATQIAEGVEVAVATVLGDPYQVALEVRDDEANPALTALITSELEVGGAVGAVGFLEDEALLAASQSRVEGMPIISPTARTAASAGEGVYSLEGPDPIAATLVARYAVERAYQRVAIILPSSDAANAEADAFEAEAARFGVPVIQRFYYEPGATFFEPQVVGARDALRSAEIAALGLEEEDTLQVEELEPVGIFLPIPREDVEYVAPQLAHFALDTLGVEVIGTSAWTDPSVLDVVDPLYMDGVVATSTVGTGPQSPGRERFRAAYEEHFQRSLVSPTAALGYDAALLLLEALRPGHVRPDQIREEFRNLRDVEGATGVFSVVDDRIVRRTELVRIRNRGIEPVPTFSDWVTDVDPR
ncbi:MAG: ABC transporter substrate-binding protein [Gemmatimonadota bacterium]